MSFNIITIYCQLLLSSNFISTQSVMWNQGIFTFTQALSEEDMEEAMVGEVLLVETKALVWEEEWVEDSVSIDGVTLV